MAINEDILKELKDIKLLLTVLCGLSLRQFEYHRDQVVKEAKELCKDFVFGEKPDPKDIKFRGVR